MAIAKSEQTEQINKFTGSKAPGPVSAAEGLRIEPTDATLGASIYGVDLNQLSNAQWQQIESAWNQYGVLIFPNQHISEAAHIELGKRIGPIEILSGQSQAVAISNQKPDGSLLNADSTYFQILKGNEGWHTDSSYMPVSARASILAAQVLPDQGGETQWADMRAAYEALDSELRARIQDLCAYHSLFHSQKKIGHSPDKHSSYGLGDQAPPLRPLVKVHPATGRPSIFVGRHAYGIPGLSEVESETLLTELVEFACQAPRTYEHTWSVGDVVMWDNRCLMHRARPYDYSQPRVLRHVRVAGDPVTEASLAY